MSYAPGGVEDADELCVLGDDFAEREPALAALARAAVSGLLPAGPERAAAQDSTNLPDPHIRVYLRWRSPP
jgi:hypothetical protein